MAWLVCLSDNGLASGKEVAQLAAGGFNVRLAKDPMDHRQHVGPGGDQWGAIFRSYSADGNQWKVDALAGLAQQIEISLDRVRFTV
jgi:hypothetical protein